MNPVMGPAPLQRHRQAGFTVVELVVTMVLMAVVAAMAFGRWQGAETRVGYQADRLARDLRHVQQLAMAWDERLRLTPAGASYSVSCVSVTAVAPCNSNPVTDPATGSAFSVVLDDATVAGAALEFDGLGRPVSGAALRSSAAQFVLTGGSNTATVTVQPLTGLTSVAY